MGSLKRKYRYNISIGRKRFDVDLILVAFERQENLLKNDRQVSESCVAPSTILNTKNAAPVYLGQYW